MSQNCGTRRVDLSAAGRLDSYRAQITHEYGNDHFAGTACFRPRQFPRHSGANRRLSISPAAHSWCQATAGPAGPDVSAWNAQTRLVAVRSAQQCPDRACADVTGRDFMSAEADGTAPAAQSAGVSGLSGAASALARVENWHHDVVTQVDGW